MARKWKDLTERARATLWEERELIVEHVFEHQCAVGVAVRHLCEQAAWDYETYLVAIVFDERSLIEETAP
jgi:hypothetical protein